jgi:capsular polysaccharide export protein
MSPPRRVLRLEDGFLRSAGLGADLVRPLSWVVDGAGIYYDATRPSDLELILQTSSFDDASCMRALKLRQNVLAARLTKYNVGFKQWRRPRADCKVILAPGQVESDASISFGAPGVRTNLDLLMAVREANPDAYLIYKPHPDVTARLRHEGREEHRVSSFCDEIVRDVDMHELLMAVDEVHVMTSLTGFEALLRGKAVTCYGQPFYAGWGLTYDIHPITRRTRELSLAQLTAGVLIDYPLYLSRDGAFLMSPEQAVEELAVWRGVTAGREPWWREGYRFFLRRIAGVR